MTEPRPEGKHSSGLWTWVWLLLALAVGYLQGPSFLQSLRPSHEQLREEVGDFFQEWASAKNYWEGIPIYTSQEETFDRYLGYPRRPDEKLAVHINGHPPASVLLVLPLGLLSYQNALLIWNLISLAALGISAFWIARELQLAVDVHWIAPAIVLMLLCFPLRQHIRLGQLNLILLAFITAAWVADRQGRPEWGGVWIGLATAIKLFPGFVVVYWLLRGQWRPVVTSAIAFAALTGLTVAILGPECFADYVLLAMPAVAPSNSAWANMSLTSMWFKLFNPADGQFFEPLVRLPALAWLGTLATGACVVALIARLIWRQPADRPDLWFAVTVLGMLVVSPVTWSHYLVLLLLPVAILWQNLPSAGPSRFILLACVALLWFDPELFSNLTGMRRGETGSALPWQTLTVLALPCYLLCAVFGLSVRTAWSDRN